MSAQPHGSPVQTDGRHGHGRDAIGDTCHSCREKIHARRADEAGDEGVVGVLVKFQRSADLLDPTGAQHDDPARQRHRFDLVVRDIDHGGFQLLMQPRDLEPHLHAQFCVKIG